MKKKLHLLLVVMILTATAQAQVLRPFASRYYNPSVRGNIVYVSNSIVSTAGIGAGSPGTGEVPPAGTTRNNAGAGINIDVDNPAPTVKIPFGSVWNYHANNAAPPNDGSARTWINSAYTLTGPWNVGASPVAGAGKYGYSSGQATCLPSGQTPICTPSSGGKYTAYYFRRNVSFTALELSTTFYSIQLNLLRNDGIVVYVNGVERIRDNMPGGAVTYGTLASADIAPGAAEAVSYNLSPSFFVAGANTIAVEVHLRATNSTNMSFDMQVLGLDNNGTLNSSTADLNIPSCSQVLFAGLYWGADQGISGTDSTWMGASFNTIKLKIPGAATYTTLTSTQTNRHSLAWSTAGFNHTGYLCFTDITSLVNASNANGTYTVADVAAPIGINNACGGWTIVIAFSNPTLQQRNLSVFDGSAIINLGDPAVDINLSGFLTPPSGPVSCELGAVVYDGDRSGSDSFAFKQNGAAGFYNLAATTVPLNGAGDAWNSKISNKGAVVTTRNPAFQNTLGYDASIFDLPNIGNAQLSNSQTAATVRFSSPSENYFVHVLTAAISQYNPTYSFEKTAVDINGGAFLPGDSLLYMIRYTNSGNDSSTNTVITDVLPPGTAYIPGSIKISTTTKTDGTGDDQAEYDFANNRIVFRVGTGATSAAGGRIGPGQLDSVQFKVATTSSCAIISCIGSIRNSARISYGGKLSGAALFDSTGVNTGGCIVQGPLIHPLLSPCSSPLDTTLGNCTNTPILLPYARYAGYTIYSAQPFIPANIYNQYVPITTTGTYWAYYSNGLGCSDTVLIQITIASPSTGPTSITAPSTTVCNPTSVTLTAVGGVLGTSANYQWGTGAVVGTSPIVGATGSTLTVTPAVTTTYWVRIENTISPCASTTGGTTLTITVRQPSMAPTSVTGADICNPGSTTLTAVGGTLGSSANYQWGTGAVVGTTPIAGATTSTLTVSPTVTTTYWVRIENTAGPCTATTSGITKTVIVSQPSTGPTSISAPSIIYCNPGSATLTAVGGTLGTSANYQWGTGAVVGTSPIAGATSSTLTVSPTVTTTYWVRIENTASPCTAATGGATVTVTVRQPSAAPTSISGADICNPGSTTLTAVGGTLGTSANYQWGTGSTVGVSPIGGATSSTLTVSPIATTTYWVRIENTAGPCSATTSGLTKTITVSQPSVAPTSITGADICNPGSTTLTAVGGTLGTSANYQWGTGAVVGTSPIGGATSSTLIVSPTATTTYWVRIENTAGPCSATTSGLTKTITVSQPSAAPTSISAPSTTICNPTSVTLTAVSGTLGTSANYQWGTGGVMGISPIGGATGSTLTVSPTVTTTYWVRIENTSSPCVATTGGTTVTITVRQPSIAPTSISGADICNPGSVVLMAVGGTLGTSANYQWGTGAVVGTSPIGGATSSTLTVSPTSTTTYWVRIENTAGPCSATTSGLTRTVTVSQPSAAPTSITGTDFCNPGSTTLTSFGATLGTSANYQWGTGTVVGISPIVGATSSTLSVSPTVTTTYWVRIENTAGPCSATTSGLTRTITVSQPSVAATAAGKNKNNICPGISVKIFRTGGTLGTGATWKWYTGSPGGTLIGSGDTLTVVPAVTTTYYVRAEGFCNTTAPQSVTIFISCDIDKDKDGIPDFIESNIAAATANGYNTAYPGYVDYNNDFINDNFQADGDSDNDGLPNYLDMDFPGRVDSNSDGIDDRFDTDLDGKINMLDLDSDNDGIPDVAEAYGVDTDGDGKIDNFTDTDGDGLSQNVDANNTGANNSSVGLGIINFDNDAVPNFLDLDSDNDGIPDVVEVGGPDTNNDGKIDGFVDANNDGLHDSYINATALLKTGADTNGDGRADSYPNKNLDRDFRPNAYDMDSDGDGIVDVIEAGLPDADLNGIVDGTIATNGWSTSVSALGSLGLRNTDTDGKPDYMDIDADDDGIPDNIEGQTTASYKLPLLTDADGDGLMLPYDNLPAAFGGSGILVYDHDGDNTPDYRDLDTDADGLIDRVEGNDYNLNGLADDNVTPTGLDTDGDGLDNRYDSLNSVTNIKGTSYRMGTNGSFTGDAAPGSKTTVQKTWAYQTDRDWRYVGYVLPVDFLSFIGTIKNDNVQLNWVIIANKDVDRFEVERSTNNNIFTKVNTVTKHVILNIQQSFSATDNIAGINTDVVYYRLKVIGKAGEIKYSNVIVVKLNKVKHEITITPNPANNIVAVTFNANKNQEVVIRLLNNLGQIMLFKNVKAVSGTNTITLPEIINYGAGFYSLQVLVNEEIKTGRLMIVR